MLFTMFSTEDSPFSQWYRGSFVVDGIAFGCAEQFMMHRKAICSATPGSPRG